MSRVPLRKQRQPRSVQTLMVLESWMCNRLLPNIELIVVGAMLLYVSLRARQGDMDFIKSMMAEKGRIVVEVSQTKTSKTGICCCKQIATCVRQGSVQIKNNASHGLSYSVLHLCNEA